MKIQLLSNDYDEFKTLSIVVNSLFIGSAASKCGNDVDCIFATMIRRGADKQTLGFWVWDIVGGREVYSPKFKHTLRYTDDQFPDVPESWQNAVSPEDFNYAVGIFNKHVATEGEYPYVVPLEYSRGDGSKIKLVCQGEVISWLPDGQPSIMIGVHWI